MPKEKVMVGMSGGVDSSVCAALLIDRGYAATGVTLRLYDGEEYERGESKTCCSLSDAEDAAAVCVRLGIPHYVFNFKEAFERDVIRHFTEVYQHGGTPNPCIECNRHIKFDAMLQRAITLGYDKIATGHYAAIRQDENGRYLLCRAADRSKDQTYVLYTLTQEQLSRLVLPLGELTKAQVREIAQEKGLITAKKPDSQDICFVPDGDYAGFIERYTGQPAREGDFLDREGRVLGRHKGVIRYTIGQRKGLGIALGEPRFVTAKDAVRNTVTLGDEQDLYARRVRIEQVNLIPFDRLEAPMRVTAKLRYSQKEQPATAIPLENGELLLEFDEPQRAPSPGQAAVLYAGDTVVGGGTVQKGWKENE